MHHSCDVDFDISIIEVVDSCEHIINRNIMTTHLTDIGNNEMSTILNFDSAALGLTFKRYMISTLRSIVEITPKNATSSWLIGQLGSAY